MYNKVEDRLKTDAVQHDVPVVDELPAAAGECIGADVERMCHLK